MGARGARGAGAGRAIAAMPKAGPSARTGNAQRQPAAAAIAGTIWMVAIVSRKPSEVCSVSAVPTACGGATSVTSALNCAESATTKKPHAHATGTSAHGLASKSRPMPSAHAPLAAIARVTTRS